VYGLGFRTFIVSKASGSAAQSGVPDAQRLALKKNANFLFLKDLGDVIELFSPSLVLTVSEAKYGGAPLDSVIERLRKVGGRDVVIAVFGGSEPGLTMQEFSMGEHVYPEGVEEDVGSIGLMAITLYTLRIIHGIGLNGD